MLMKVVKEDISKILARAEITESTQWLTVKERKHTLNSEKSALGPFVLEMSVCSKDFSLVYEEIQYRFIKSRIP